jgi:hypothetical protein
MTAASALMGGWKAAWRPADTKVFGATVAATSVSATCGTTTLAGTFTYDVNYLLYTLPTTANTATVGG